MHEKYADIASLVDNSGHLSNLIIIQDLAKVIDFLDNKHLEDFIY